ncbi:Maf-like protein [Falsiporphyromonas endometrii]|uniref:dTTP/UTP pyrophosphatase n=1 Tax=Falsiporphyromonas endometrii TaxID=1387297 RepID=A0ABV9K5D7_9PORP
MKPDIYTRLKNYHIILGSQSPRRKQLLQGLDISFEQKPMPDIDEIYPPGLDAVDVPEYLARLKASAYKNEMREDTLLITADTVVIIDNEILGKPHDRSDAIEMLQKISGREHMVVSGVCLTKLGEQQSFSSRSFVTFAEIPIQEITYYIDKYKPFDKAGAYGIQEWIGYVAIQKIEGSFYNVMGLPVHQLFNSLKNFV